MPGSNASAERLPWLAEFKRGALATPLWPLVAAFLLGAATIFFVDRWMGARWFSIITEPMSGIDDITHVMYLTHGLREQPPKQAIYLIGTSAFNEAVDRIEDVRSELQKRGEAGLAVELLASASQTLLEANVILENLPTSDRPGLVLFIGYDRLFARNQEGQLKKIMFWERLEYPPITFGLLESDGVEPPWSDQIRLGWSRFFMLGPVGIKWQWINGSYTKNHFDPHAADLRKTTPQNGPENTLKSIKEEISKQAEADVRLNGMLLVNFIRMARKKNLTPIFVESPLHSQIVEYFASRGERPTRRFESFASENGVEYWNFVRRLNFSDADFRSGNHLNNHKARLNFQNALIQQINERMKKNQEVGVQ